MLKIKLTKSPEEYQLGQLKLAEAELSFLQSYQYGQMQADIGNEPLYMLVVNENEEIVCSYLAIYFKAKRGRYFFVPYAVLDRDRMALVLDFLKAISRTMKADFIRMSPLLDDDSRSKRLFTENGFRDAPVHMMHPELLWLLDLSADEKKLLVDMRKNTRYAIKQAEKMQVNIISGCSEDLLQKFYEIHLETSRRQHFVPYPLNYLKAELAKFGICDELKIYLAEYEGKIISGAVIVMYGNEAVYHHGASLSEFNKIPGSYLIQWEAIKEAKKRGMSKYNFWGVVENAPKHPWAGLSFFKQGFGGVGRPLLHCQDLPLTWKYWSNDTVETVRRIKRGY